MKVLSPNPETYNFVKIGHVKSGYPDKFGVPRQSGLVHSVASEIIIENQYQPEISLQGLERFTHLWILFIFHLNDSKGFNAKVHPPRMNGGSIGVFATRSPHRPNPVGLSLVKIKKVHRDRIEVDGIDLVDGTPVIDIKPYLPQFEIREDAKAGWVEETSTTVIVVEFDSAADIELNIWIQQSGHGNLRQAITDIIRQDPRPVIYRGSEETGGKYRQNHVFRLYEKDVRFKFLTADHAIVTAISNYSTSK